MLEKVRKTTNGAYEHQEYPFSMILEDVQVPRDTTRSPLFDVMVQQINSENDIVIRFGDAQMEVYQRESTQSKYDLVFNFSQNGQKLSLRLEYSTKLFKNHCLCICSFLETCHLLHSVF